MTHTTTPRIPHPAGGAAGNPTPRDSASFGDPEAFANLPTQGVIALDFTAAWCGPCRTMRPVLAAIADEYARDVRLVEVDVEEQPALAEQFQVRAMPTFVILRDGREVGRFVGSRPRGFVRGVLDRALAGDVAITAP